MKTLKGDFWKVHRDYDAIVCTTNQVVKKNGLLVMGVGIAADFADRFPQLPFLWGRENSKQPPPSVIFTKIPNIRPYLVALPTKRHWQQKSDLNLIRQSAEALRHKADELKLSSVLMTPPGCGLGGLDWTSQVFPLLEPLLDDRFTVISK